MGCTMLLTAAILLLSMTALLIAATDALTIPIVSPDELVELDRGSIYAGSMSVAGLAIFGSATLGIIRQVTKTSPNTLRVDAAMFVVGAFAFAGTHVYFASAMCCVNPADYLPHVGIFSVTLLGISGYGFIGLLTRKDEAGNTE